MVLALNNRGYANYFLGDLDKALDDFDIAINLESGFAEASLNKSSILASQNNSGSGPGPPGYGHRGESGYVFAVSQPWIDQGAEREPFRGMRGLEQGPGAWEQVRLKHMLRNAMNKVLMIRRWFYLLTWRCWFQLLVSGQEDVTIKKEGV